MAGKRLWQYNKLAMLITTELEKWFDGFWLILYPCTKQGMKYAVSVYLRVPKSVNLYIHKFKTCRNSKKKWQKEIFEKESHQGKRQLFRWWICAVKRNFNREIDFTLINWNKIYFEFSSKSKGDEIIIWFYIYNILIWKTCNFFLIFILFSNSITFVKFKGSGLPKYSNWCLRDHFRKKSNLSSKT